MAEAQLAKIENKMKSFLFLRNKCHYTYNATLNVSGLHFVSMLQNIIVLVLLLLSLLLWLFSLLSGHVTYSKPISIGILGPSHTSGFLAGHHGS